MSNTMMPRFFFKILAITLPPSSPIRLAERDSVCSTALCMMPRSSSLHGNRSPVLLRSNEVRVDVFDRIIPTLGPQWGFSPTLVDSR